MGTTEHKSRNNTLDLLKFFAIILVLWGHSIQFFCQGHYSNNSVYRIIYSFHMPLFMMIVGFFASKLYKIDFISFFRKKFRQLILPSLTMTLIMILVGVLILNERMNINGFIGSFLYSFWFLKSAFVCSLIYWVSEKVCPKSSWGQ